MKYDPRLYSDRTVFRDMLGSRLRTAMGLKGWGYRQAAKAAGIHPMSLEGYLMGRHEPSAWAVRELARALEVDAGWLLGLEGGDWIAE